MEATKRTLIGGYVVELELFEEDGEQRSSCIISTPRGHWSASLAWAEDTGTLTSSKDFEDRPIKDEAVARIRAWADENGY